MSAQNPFGDLINRLVGKQPVPHLIEPDLHLPPEDFQPFLRFRPPVAQGAQSGAHDFAGGGKVAAGDLRLDIFMQIFGQADIHRAHGVTSRLGRGWSCWQFLSNGFDGFQVFRFCRQILKAAR